jgi:hypothetical protein
LLSLSRRCPVGELVPQARLQAAVELAVREALRELVPEFVGAIHSALAEERLMGAILAAGDRPPTPLDLELEELVIGAAVAGEVELEALADLKEEDFGVPLYGWVLARLREGATDVSTLIAAAEGAGYCGPGLRAKLHELALVPVVLVPSTAERVSTIKERARARKIQTHGHGHLSKLATGEITSDGCLDELGKMAAKRRAK